MFEAHPDHMAVQPMERGSPRSDVRITSSARGKLSRYLYTNQVRETTSTHEAITPGA